MFTLEEPQDLAGPATPALQSAAGVKSRTETLCNCPAGGAALVRLPPLRDLPQQSHSALTGLRHVTQEEVPLGLGSSSAPSVGGGGLESAPPAG